MAVSKCHAAKDVRLEEFSIYHLQVFVAWGCVLRNLVNGLRVWQW